MLIEMTTPERGTDEYKVYKQSARDDAKWQSPADVDWTDLEHFVRNCRRNKDRESFDTAIRILEALKKQVLER